MRGDVVNSCILMWSEKLQGITDGDRSYVKNGMEVQWFKTNEISQNYVIESKFSLEPLVLIYYSSNG